MRLSICLLSALISFHLAQAHPGPVNDEGCHKNSHNDVLHCHKHRGKIIELPKKAVKKAEKKSAKTKKPKGKRSIASIQQTMSGSQKRLLEFECCVGASYLSKATCKAFGHDNWKKRKHCSKTPANLDYDLSQTLLKRVRCYECCTGEELLGKQYCANRGFKNWRRGKRCGCP